MIRAVLFDLDGTFADTAPDLATALNHTRATRHLPPLPLATLRLQASHGSRGLLKIGFDIEPDSPDFNTLRDIFLDYYAHHICVHTQLFDGIETLIDKLDQRSIKWGIVTNKPHRFTVALMQALSLSSRAVCLISGDTCARAKPHPDPLLKACELLGLTPQQCLYLGDDIRDIQAANAAGMHGIIARYGYISADPPLETWGAHGGVDHPMELLNFFTL